MNIKLSDILKIGNPNQYKLHLGGANTEGDHPLDAFIESENNWQKWNEWRGTKNEWTKKYILSLIEFYPKPNTWLFGGVFEVIDRNDDSYKLSIVEEFQLYTGRLLLNFTRYQGLRGRAFLLENFIDDISVNQVFEYKYSGEVFPGFERINHNFRTIETIYKAGRSDWKSALESVKGVYLITDMESGKMYVGSAYGDSGIWSRWGNYIGSLHGWNDRLIALIKEKGPDYAKSNFQFTLLEVYGLHASDEQIISRENYWKEKLSTRKFGYNAN